MAPSTSTIRGYGSGCQAHLPPSLHPFLPFFFRHAFDRQAELKYIGLNFTIFPHPHAHGTPVTRTFA